MERHRVHIWGFYHDITCVTLGEAAATTSAAGILIYRDLRPITALAHVYRDIT